MRKTNSTKSWKRVAAGALSMALVAGAVPMNFGGLLTQINSYAYPEAPQTGMNYENIAPDESNPYPVYEIVEGMIFRYGQTIVFDGANATITLDGEDVEITEGTYQTTTVCMVTGYYYDEGGYEIELSSLKIKTAHNSALIDKIYFGDEEYEGTDYNVTYYSVGNEPLADAPTETGVWRMKIHFNEYNADAYNDFVICDTRQAFELEGFAEDDEYAWNREPETKTVTEDGNPVEYTALKPGTTYYFYSNKFISCDSDTLTIKQTQPKTTKFTYQNKNYRYRFKITVTEAEDEIGNIIDSGLATIKFTPNFALYNSISAEGAESDMSTIWVECQGEYEIPEGGDTFETVKFPLASLKTSSAYYFGDYPDADDIYINEELAEFGATVDKDGIQIKYYDANNTLLTSADSLTFGETYYIEARVPVTINGRTTYYFLTKEFSYKKFSITKANVSIMQPNPEFVSAEETPEVSELIETPLEIKAEYQKTVDLDDLGNPKYDIYGNLVYKYVVDPETNQPIVAAYTVTIPNDALVYSGQEYTMPELILRNSSNNLDSESNIIASENYTVTGTLQATNAGSYFATLATTDSEENCYEGMLNIEWGIAKADLSEDDISLIGKTKIYDGAVMGVNDFEFSGKKEEELLTSSMTGVTLSNFKEAAKVVNPYEALTALQDSGDSKLEEVCEQLIGTAISDDYVKSEYVVYDKETEDSNIIQGIEYDSAGHKVTLHLVNHVIIPDRDDMDYTALNNAIEPLYENYMSIIEEMPVTPDPAAEEYIENTEKYEADLEQYNTDIAEWVIKRNEAIDNINTELAKFKNMAVSPDVLASIEGNETFDVINSGSFLLSAKFSKKSNTIQFRLGGANGIDAGVQTADVTITSQNYNDFTIHGVTFEILKRDVTVTPVANQSITFGEKIYGVPCEAYDAPSYNVEGKVSGDYDFGDILDVYGQGIGVNYTEGKKFSTTLENDGYLTNGRLYSLEDIIEDECNLVIEDTTFNKDDRDKMSYYGNTNCFFIRPSGELVFMDPVDGTSAPTYHILPLAEGKYWYVEKSDGNLMITQREYDGERNLYVNAGSYGYVLQDDAKDYNYNIHLANQAVPNFFTVNRKSINSSTEYNATILDQTLTMLIPETRITIKSANEEEDPISNNNTFIYSGKTHSVAVDKVIDNALGIELNEGSDYTVSNTSKVNPGHYSVQVKGTSNYIDTGSETWSIEEKNAYGVDVEYADNGVSGTTNAKTFDGISIANMVTVDLGEIPEKKATVTKKYYKAVQNEQTEEWVIDPENNTPLEEAPVFAGDYIIDVTVKAKGYKTYNEQLPVHVGKRTVKVNGILDKTSVDWNEPTPEVTNTILNNFIIGYGLESGVSVDKYSFPELITWTLDAENKKYTGIVNENIVIESTEDDPMTPEELAEINEFVHTNFEFDIEEPTYEVTEDRDLNAEGINVEADRITIYNADDIAKCNIKVTDTVNGETVELVEGEDYTINGREVSVSGDYIIEIVGVPESRYSGVREIEWTASTQKELNDSVVRSFNIKSFAPEAVLDEDGGRYVKAKYTFDQPTENCEWNFISSGIVYSNNDTIASVDELKTAYAANTEDNPTIDGENIIFTEKSEIDIPDLGNGVVAVGVVNVVNNVTGYKMTYYTDDFSGNFENIVASITKFDAAAGLKADNDKRIRIKFKYQVNEGWTLVEAGTIYCNDGTTTSIEDLTYENALANKKHIIKKANTNFTVPDIGYGVTAVGFIKAKDSNGLETIIYTDNLGGSFDSLAVNVKTFDPVASLKDGEKSIRIKFKYEVSDNWQLVESGTLYCNDGAITSIDELKTKTSGSKHVKVRENTNFRIVDNGYGVLAVGFIKIKDTSTGYTTTIFTDDLGGSYDALSKE
jgi:hypothetical protein